MKRLIDITESLDKLIVEESKKLGYPVTHLIRQILWQYFENQARTN